MEYFSDGYAAQYKNCMHSQDFGLQGTWSFFATSRVKSPCDGIGGTVKRATAMESLQRPLQHQIGSLDAMLTFCNEKLTNISSRKISKKDLDLTREHLENRFRTATTIKSTKGFHCFKPDSPSKISMKLISNDVTFSYTSGFHSLAHDAARTAAPVPNLGDYVAAIYDQNWYVGVILDTDATNGDTFVNFMQPHGPSTSFSWPKHEDKCWVPSEHVLCIIDSPNLANTRGQYHFSKESIDCISTKRRSICQ